MAWDGYPGESILCPEDDKDLSLGIGFLSYFGASLKYDDNWVGRYYGQELTLIGFTLMPAVIIESMIGFLLARPQRYVFYVQADGAVPNLVTA